MMNLLQIFIGLFSINFIIIVIIIINNEYTSSYVNNAEYKYEYNL
jgi:hypothetical protein